MTFFFGLARTGLPHRRGAPKPPDEPRRGCRDTRRPARTGRAGPAPLPDAGPHRGVGLDGWDDAPPAYSPWGYGYTNYSPPRFRPHLLRYVDAPGFGDHGRADGAGRDGIAVSAACKARDVAVDYAFWIAGAGVSAGALCRLPAATRARGGLGGPCPPTPCAGISPQHAPDAGHRLPAARYDGYMGLQDRRAI